MTQNSLTLSKHLFRHLIANNYFRCRSVSNYALVYEQFGDPLKVVNKVELKDVTSDRLESKQVLLQYLASPINPADINTIQGVYAIKPKLPAVGGNEGVARVVKVGDGVTNVKIGDWISVSGLGGGTWKFFDLMPCDHLMLIDNTIDLLSASQLRVNPCTAYRMLKDFVQLQNGDTVIQNGSNSAVGLNVIQLAREWGINTINVVRSRPDLDQLKERLTSLGANHVITEEDLRQSDVMEKVLSQTSKPKLALNCVGGKNATDCMRYLDSGGVMVTYGGMSKQPLTIPTGSLIFKDQRFVGFWMTRWSQLNYNSNENREMIANLCALIKNKKLLSPISVEINLDDYKEALEKCMQGFQNVKYVFVMK